MYNNKHTMQETSVSKTHVKDVVKERVVTIQYRRHLSQRLTLRMP